MKAIRIHEDGGPEVLRYEDVPDPVPRDDEALVELRAASLNHLDVWIRRGLPSVPKPRILGADGAGVIAGTGTRVVINPGIMSGGKIHIVGETMDGTHAELIAVPRGSIHPIPDSLSFEDAAAFPLVFVTAYRMLVTRARVQEGEWVLIWGIGGGVATAALSIAKSLGAKVAVTSSSDEKLSRARELGADLGINHTTGDVVYENVQPLTPEDIADSIYWIATPACPRQHQHDRADAGGPILLRFVGSARLKLRLRPAGRGAHLETDLGGCVPVKCAA